VLTRLWARETSEPSGRVPSMRIETRPPFLFQSRLWLGRMYEPGVPLVRATRARPLAASYRSQGEPMNLVELLILLVVFLIVLKLLGAI
jgi:hypothetical protein